MTNHESIKLILGFSLTVITGFVFFKCKELIVSNFGVENFYLILAYSAVTPPFLLNKLYDLTIKKAQKREKKKLALSIDENDEVMESEGVDIKQLIKNKKNETKEKLDKFKEIELSKKTL